MFDKPPIIVRYCDATINILELNELDNLIKHIFYDEMIIFLGQLTVLKKGQIEKVMHLELHYASRSLNFLEDIKLLF